jgi:hypothetical protein
MNMPDRSHLMVQATAWRELARRAKRLAKGLLDGPDRGLLLQYAEELEEKAARMDTTRLEDPAEPEGAATARGSPRSSLASRTARRQHRGE